MRSTDFTISPFLSVNKVEMCQGGLYATRFNAPYINPVRPIS